MSGPPSARSLGSQPILPAIPSPRSTEFQMQQRKLQIRAQTHVTLIELLINNCQRYLGKHEEDRPCLAMAENLSTLRQIVVQYKTQVCRPEFELMPVNSRNSQRQRLAQMLVDSDSKLVDENLNKLKNKVSAVLYNRIDVSAVKTVYFAITNLIRETIDAFAAMCEVVDKLPRASSNRANSVDASAMAAQLGLSPINALSAAANGSQLPMLAVSPRTTTTTTTTTTTVALNMLSPRPPAQPGASSYRSPTSQSPTSASAGGEGPTFVVSAAGSSVSIYLGQVNGSSGDLGDSTAAVTSTTTTTSCIDVPVPPLGLPPPPRSRPAAGRSSWPAGKPKPSPAPAAQFAANSRLVAVQEHSVANPATPDANNLGSPPAIISSAAFGSTKLVSPRVNNRRLVAVSSTSPLNASPTPGSVSPSGAMSPGSPMSPTSPNPSSPASLVALRLARLKGSPSFGSGSSAFDSVHSMVSTSPWKPPRISWVDATTSADNTARVVQLERGGTVVSTCIGNIQVGMPPETIKDSMKLGIPVSQFFVIPRSLFDHRSGINVAEFEFPAYYNFFIRGQTRTTLITTPEVEKRIREVFRETLLGPEDFSSLPNDFSKSFPIEDAPDLRRECDHFGKNPFSKPPEPMSVDTLLRFIHFDEHGFASIPAKDESSSVQIQVCEQDFLFIQDGTAIAKVPSLMQLPPLPPVQVRDVFNPPQFGVTMLGCSHGFDPSGSTTGFVIWINGRGLMVDPPPNSSHVMAREGIPARLIDGVIVTHCHADHDAGSFQKILQEKRIMLMTTATVCNSFLRKYSALSDMPVDFLRSLFEFRPAVIGESITWHGAQLRFFYAFHSIPCVGFECSYGGKSFVYSADTFFDPAKIQDLCSAGVLSSGRAGRLINFPFATNDLILHEAGIPPLHTPASILQQLPADQLNKLYLVHIAAGAVPAGMRRLEAGVAHTVELPVASLPVHASAIETLDLIGNIEMFQSLTIEQAREVLICSRRVQFSAGSLISAPGMARTDSDDAFFIISRGVAQVRSGKLVKKFTAGDFFGEETFVTAAEADNAGMEVIAETDVECLALNRNHFLYLLNNRADIIGRLRHLHNMRRLPSWEAIERNSLLRELSSSQKTELQAMMHVRTLVAGQHLWQFNQEGSRSEAVLVLTAELQLMHAETQVVSRHTFGHFLAEVRAMASGVRADQNSRALFFPQSYSVLDDDIGHPHKTELVCVSAGDVFVFPTRPFVELLRRTPKLFLELLSNQIIDACSEPRLE